MNFVFPPSPTVAVPVRGQDAAFPVHRIYCVGRNYEEHAKEMGFTGREPPFFFMKPADAVVADGRDPRFPPATSNLHFEVEMVAALHSGGRDIAVADALAHVYGYAVGVDLTRRDLQAAAKAKGNPWDTAKGFDDSAPVSALVPADGRHPLAERLRLAVNGVPKQDTSVADMLWPLPEIITELSKLYELKAGDLIFTGTPAGVGPLQPGDRVHCSLDGWATLEFGVSA